MERKCVLELRKVTFKINVAIFPRLNFTESIKPSLGFLVGVSGNTTLGTKLDLFDNPLHNQNYIFREIEFYFQTAFMLYSIFV